LDPLTTPPPTVRRFYTLPNGLEVACQSAKETDHIYEDIFDHRVYLSHGITLWDGATVFDVGGNIGMFSVFVQQNWRNALTYTFEPAPPLFDILHYNTARYGGQLGGTCRLFQCGISDTFKTARLTFYPYSSGMSSFYGNVEEEKDVLRRVLKNQSKAGLAEADAFAENPEEFLDARFTEMDFECPLLPLSEIIEQEGVEAIDLLKVDVQKSELDVLRGLAPEDWPKVRQIAMEVHDLDGQLAETKELLANKGFNVVVEQDPLYVNSVMYNLFAIHQDLYKNLALAGQKKVLTPRGANRGKQAFKKLRRQRKNR
jgi:FkbM family methyltransferase